MKKYPQERLEIRCAPYIILRITELSEIWQVSKSTVIRALLKHAIDDIDRQPREEDHGTRPL